MARFSIMAAGGGSVRFRGCPVYHGTYMKPSYLEFREIVSDAPIAWAVGDYVDYPRTGLRYRLYDLPETVQNSEKSGTAERYVYSRVSFYAGSKDLTRSLFRDLVTADNTIHYSSRKTISTYEDVAGIAARIQSCLDYDLPGEWSVVLDADLAASVPSVSEEREFSIESGSTILDALDHVYSVWENVGWTYSYDSSAGKNILTIGGANTKRAGNTVAGGTIGKGSGLTSVKVTFAKLDDVCTRLYPFGSSRNMKARYYNSLDIKDAESVDIPHLMIPVSSWGLTDSLPDPKKAFIRVASLRDERLLGVRQKVLYFDDEEYGEIYPSIEGVTIGDIRSAKASTDKYYPSTDIYTDSERADEVKSAGTASLDDGTAADGAVTQTVTPECDAALNGTVGSSGSVTVTKKIGYASPVMGRWSDIVVGNGQAYIYAEMDTGVSLDGAFLTLHSLGNEVNVSLSAAYDSATGRTALSVPDGCEFLHENFFTVSDADTGNQFIIDIYLTVTFSGSVYLESSAFSIAQSNSDPIAVSLRDGHPTRAAVTLKQIGFDPASQRLSATGKVGTLEMKTGGCAGRSFRIEGCSYNSSADEWVLNIRRVVDRSVGMTFPNTVYPIAAGDRFVLTDITMPDEYIEYASQRLLTRAQAVLAELSHPIAVLTPSMDAKFIKENGRTFLEGRFLDFDASLLSQGYMVMGYYSDLIDTLTINENESSIPTYSLTLRERPRKSFKLPSDSAASTTEDVESSSGTSSSSSSATGVKGDKGEKGDKGDKGDDGTGIASVTQTTTSTADGGENVVTVGLTDGTSSQFTVRNGSKGSKGNTGSSAGFGTPTATAASLPSGSSPTVSVTASGPDTAKIFSFAFGIPKGASGGGGGAAEVVAYPDYLDMTEKDAETLYAVTYKEQCDLYLGEIRITKNITAVLPESMTVSGPVSLGGGAGAQATYTASISPSEATEREVTWSCVSGIATISSSGVLTASGRGTAVVKAASAARPSVGASVEVAVNTTMKVVFTGQGFDTARTAAYKYLFIRDSLNTGVADALLSSDFDGAAPVNGCTFDAASVQAAREAMTATASNLSLLLSTTADITAGVEVAEVEPSVLQGILTAWDNVSASVLVELPETDVEVTGISITGLGTVYASGNTARYVVKYTPSDTTQKGVTWSVESGAAYASIDQNGLLTVKSGADGDTVKIRATSAYKTGLYAEKSVNVTYYKANPAWNLTSALMLDPEGGTVTIKVSDSDGKGWQVTVPSWLTLQSGSLTGTGSGTLTLAYAANTGGSKRSGSVALLSGSSTVSSCTATQDAFVALTGLAIESDNVVDGKISGGGVFKAVYTPSDTTQTGVVWSIVSGADYATIDSGGSTGECTVLFSADEAAVGQTVTIRCASTENAAIHADITVTIEEAAVADWSITGATSLEAVVGGTSQYGIDWGDVAEEEVTWSLENAVYTPTGLVFAEIGSADGLLTIGEGWNNVAWPSSRTIGVTATLAGGESKTLEVTIVKNSG